VLFDQDRGGSLLGHHAPDRPRQFFHDDGCESLERLVEQQQRRVRHERARDREHLLLASGELVAHVRLALGEARKQFVYSLQVPAPGTRRHGQVLLERQRRENLALLRDPAQTPARPRVRRGGGHVPAAPQDGAAHQPGIAHEGEEQGGLADSVSAEHGEATVLADLEGHVVEHHGIAVAGAHALEPEQGLSHELPCLDKRPAPRDRGRSHRGFPRRGSCRRP